MKPLKPCIACGARTRRTRCPICEAQYQRARNQHPTRSKYAGTWKATSKAARKAQPWCSVCGATTDLTLDHENAQVECRRCNSSHSRGLR